MASIDERVVAMAFENAKFETEVARTMATLTKLDQAIKTVGTQGSGFQNIDKEANKVTLQGPMSALDKLKGRLSNAGQGAADGLGEIDRAGNKVTLEGPSRAIDKIQGKMGQLSAGTTFTDIERASDKVELAGVSRALDGVTQKFSVLQGAASVALGNIASQAAMRGASFAKSFALGPLQQGLEEYQTNLGSIQTILSNTADSGGNLKTVNAALSELNTYSDKTIYNFSEMAKNIGTFTAAGVQLKPATAAIKGIANLAALSGSNSQQASTAMYQLSQAIAAGRVGLQDWNSVVNAGMGGAVFQKSLMRTAENMGALEKGAVKIDKATGKATVNGKSFRESIMAKPGEQSWLTSDVLTQTLSQLTGDMSDAELAAKGFSAEQIKAIQHQAKMAQDAATQVKTLPQVFDVARETIGSGWSQTFQLIFGDFGESKKTFTDLSNAINGLINKMSTARNKVLTEWKKLGGRDELIAGIKQAFKDLGLILKPIHEAFQDIFPPKTGKDLFAFTKSFHELMVSLRPTPEVVIAIRRGFDGLFAIVHIGWSIIKGFIGLIGDLLGVMGHGSGGFLHFVDSVGYFLMSIDQALTKGGLLNGFFKALGAIIKLPISLLGDLAHAIANLFTGDKESSKGFEDSIDNVKTKLGPLKGLIDAVGRGWDSLVGILGKVKDALQPWFDQMANKLSQIGDIFAHAFSNLDYDTITKALQTGFLGGIFLTLKKAFADGLPSVFGDSLKGVNDLLGGFTGQLQAMQTKIKAEALAAIAAAIVLLAGGIWVLSKINGEDMQRAMTGVAVGLGELMGGMKLMTSGMGLKGVAQLPFISASIVGLAIAVTIMAGAVKIFSTMSWEDIGKGLAGVAGSITAIGLAMNLMGGAPKLQLQALGLIAIGAALNLIALSMKQFATMSWEQIAKGLFSVVEALGGIALGVSMMPANLPVTAAGLILMGIALDGIAVAIKAMGGLDILTIIKGLGAMMAAIAGIGLAISLVPPTIALSAVGLLLVGQAMVVTAGAIALLGNLKMGTLVKGLVGLAGALVVMAAGLTLMIASAPGALGLMMTAAALTLLVPALGLLGSMKWETIFKGLAALAATLLTIGVVGLIAAPALAAIGIALIPLGLGFMLLAKSAQIFAEALALLGANGPKNIAILTAAITAFVLMVPNILVGIIKGFVEVASAVADVAPKVVLALGVVIDAILAYVVQAAPKLAMAVGALVDAFVQVIVRDSPKLIAAGAQLIFNLLNGIAQNIGRLTEKAAEILVNFMNALAAKMPQITASGARLLVAFVTGITSNMGKVITAVAGMITKFLGEIAKHVGDVVKAGAHILVKFIEGLGQGLVDVAKAGTHAITKFIEGVGNSGRDIVKSAGEAAGKFIKAMATALVKLANTAMDAIIDFLNGLATAIRTHTKEMNDAGANVADAIIDGMVDGLERLAPGPVKVIKKIAGGLIGGAKKVLGIFSPSKEFQIIGQNVVLGLHLGLEEMGHMLNDSVRKPLKKVLAENEDAKDWGKYLMNDLASGLRGNTDQIGSAMTSLQDRLSSDLDKLNDKVKSDQDKLNELIMAGRAGKPVNQKELTDIYNSLGYHTRLLQAAQQAASNLWSGLTAERDQLLALSASYDDVSKRLEGAQQALDAATQARDEAIKSYTDQYSKLPELAGILDKALADADMTAQERYDKAKKEREDARKKAQIDQVAEYKKAIAEQIKATAKYMETLQKLRELGLDDTTYKRLLSEGTQDQGFADQLLRGGKKSIDELNDLDSKLLETSKDLADQAAKNLYQAGVDAAQGLVDGLKAQQQNIKDQMNWIANAMVAQIKAALGIASPSKKFAEIGKLTMRGMTDGLKASRGEVKSSMEDTAADLIQTAQNTLGKVPNALEGMMEMDPTITPVLDLTQVKKDAQALGDMTNVTPITAAVSYKQAATISAESQSAEAAAAAQAGSGGNSFQFIQNNTSPKSLSEIEIYRQTNNQLAMLKRAVGV